MILHANYATLPLTHTKRTIQVQSRMLLWCRSGHGTVTVNDVKWAMAPGDFLFLPWMHRILYRANPGASWELGGIHLVPEVATAARTVFEIRHDCEGAGRDNPDHRDGDWPEFAATVAGQLPLVPHLEALLDYIVAWFQSPLRTVAGSHALAGLLLAELRHYRKSAAYQCRTLPPELAALLERLEDKLTGPLQIDDLVRISGYGRSTLFRLFQSYLGLPPNQWLTRQRLQHGAEQLRRTALPLKTIAQASGIGDVNYFSRLFKKHYGLPPEAYRRRQQML